MSYNQIDSSFLKKPFVREINFRYESTYDENLTEMKTFEEYQ